MKGTDFLSTIMNLPLGPEREEAIYQAGRQHFVLWDTTEVLVQYQGHEIGFVVSNDYFAIGEPGDYVRVPMNPLTAQRLADTLGFMLPTPRMVDLIWVAAPVKLEPHPMVEVQGTTAQMSTKAFADHNAFVERQLDQLGRPGGLVAGIKKDVVLTNRLDSGVITVREVSGPPHTINSANQVAIYGWHRRGQAPDCSQHPTIPGLCPIQGLSIVHDNRYADYSHGIRSVGLGARIDGDVVSITTALQSPEFSAALSHEGVLRVLRQPGVPIA